MTQGAPAKVLFCEHNVDGTVGGSYYSLLFLARSLDRTRFQPTVVFYSEHSLLPAFRDAGITTLVWPRAQPFTFGSRLTRRVGRLAWPLAVLQKALNFARGFVAPALSHAWFLRAQGFAIVHLNNSALYNHDWMLAARLAGTRCVTHERGINDHYPAPARYFGRRLDAVICISEAVRLQMQSRGADFGNLITIHNGLDPETMRVQTPAHALRTTHGIPLDAIVIGMVGNIRSWKGQDTLVRAIDQVRRTYPSVRAVLVGDTSPADRQYERELRELIGSLGLESHVVFTGFQRNVTDYLAMSDVVVHTSVSPEPFGRVVLEAMACRKPFIGSRAGAIPEIVDEGRTGLTFPPGDSAALAEAINRVIADPVAARRMGELGYERLVSQFHISRNTEATERLYERLLSAAR